ncbi:MAG: Zn-dependent hydrolase [Pseudomonadota bacterium]
MNQPTNLSVNGERLWASLMEMAEIGATPKGGVNRLTLTELDRDARQLFQRWCEDAGLTVAVDAMGSMFARRPGQDNALPPVMIGSHLDTQPTGGKFDGALGVIAALELVRSLNDLGVTTRHPIEIANFTNEEGSRFTPAMVASGVFAGAFSLDYALARTDDAGVKLGDALSDLNLAGPEPVGGRDIKAFFELHIEQGPILEEDELDVGVVTHANGQRWFDVTLTGVESHAGPTPMERRKDALVGAARVVDLVHSIGHGYLPNACATCGRIEVFPASRNVIPGRAWVTVDLRHPDDVRLDQMTSALLTGVQDIATQLGLSADVKEIFAFPVTTFDQSCVDAVRKAAADLGLRHCDIVSGAGHDAVYMARVAPTAMIFTPCIGGISHNEAEDMKPEWATAGANVLLRAAVEMAEIVT